jgi:hypothetical protein
MQNEILNYIQQEKQRGATDEQITQALINSGWQETEIQEAFRFNTEQNTEIKTPVSDNEIKNTPVMNRRLIFIIVAIVIFLCAGGLFAMKYAGKTKITDIEKEKQTKNVAVPLVENNTTSTKQKTPLPEDVAVSPTTSGVENNIVPENKPSSTSFDCGTDKACMIKYAEKCQRAMGITLMCQDQSIPCEENNSNNKLYKSEDYIFGGTANACKYQSELVFMVMPNSMIPVKGLIMTCTLTASEIKQVYSGGLGNDLIFSKCSGTWVEYIKQQMNPKFLPINSSVSIEVDECLYLKGRPRGVQENNTACASNEVDLGTMIKDDSGKALTQCCKIK